MRTLAIAVIQTAPIAFDQDATWELYAQQVRAVRNTFSHVQLVVVPELMLMAEGSLLQARDGWMEQTAISIPSPDTDRICALAKETGLWLVPGSVYERGVDQQIYNTALAVSPQGEIIATYRKIFPWQPYETSTPGDEFVVFDIPEIGRVGLAICYDGSFPETARQLAWLGAEVIIQPTLTPTCDRDMELVCARANAWTNQVYVVNVNGASPSAVGASVIVDPEGTIRQQAGEGEEVLIDVLDLDAVTMARTFGTMGINRPWDQVARHGGSIRLPMYGGATMKTPPWHEKLGS